ncbi:Fc.00g079530.m01.CDS01 [Cosmosporella sp. VM-42]
MKCIGAFAFAVAIGEAVAHSGVPSLPNLMAGREALERVGPHRRDGFERRFRASEEHDVVEKRQVSTNGRCGTGFGTTCNSDECCSSAGWCGTGYIYCSAPSCQIDYGPACDANVRPSGPDTENTPRPKVGSIPYGQAIYHCEEYGDIALSYDDGPYTYTEDLLNLLKKYSAKATFFITGRNLGKGAINDPATPWPGLIKRMIAEGHQVASHTWSHQRLTTLSEQKFRNQILFNEIAFADILGYFPTYMRPPYSASNSTTDAWLNDLGYHIAYFNLDTEGYLHDSPNLIQASKDIWDAAVEGADTATTKWLGIEHDPVYQSVYNLTEYMLKSLFANDFNSVTVGECLGDPKANWYRSVSGDTTPSSSTSTTKVPTGTSTTSSSTATGSFPPTINGRCGFGQGDQTCKFEPSDKCCSQKGWCGSTEDHCGRGCQPLFGSCNDTPTPGTSSTSTTKASTSTSSTKPASTLSTSTNKYPQPTSSAPISKDGRCGPSFGGTTCIKEPGATCCSSHGWCGNTTDHCGTGCQPLYGTCGTSNK